MPATIATISPGLLAMLRTGDEAAIERIYRDNYRALLDAATRELGDVTRAARAIERAAADLWKARAQLESSESFDRLLGALLHERIVQEKVRMATRHRHAPALNGGPPAPAPSADVSWEHVKALLHPSPAPSVLATLQSEARHVTAEHFAAVVRPRRSYWPIVIGSVGVLAVLALLLANRGDDVAKALSSPDARSISAKAGQRATFTLGDGTTSTLGSVSSVTIPPGFPARLRTIALQGTASFRVAPNADLPFVVRADRATITARGTIFDVSAFPEAALLTVRVREGDVAVATGNETLQLTTGAAVTVERSGAIRAATATEIGETLGWIGGRIEIVDRPLRDALPIIRRWYDIDMRSTDEKLLDRRITISIALDSTRVAIQEVERKASVKLFYDKGSALLRDAAGQRRKK